MMSREIRKMLGELENARDEEELAFKFAEFEGKVAEKVVTYEQKAEHFKKLVTAMKSCDFNHPSKEAQLIRSLAAEAKDDLDLAAVESHKYADLYKEGHHIVSRKFKEFKIHK